MSQRNIILLSLISVVVILAGFMTYDIVHNHRINKIFKNEKDNWQWNDKWTSTPKDETEPVEQEPSDSPKEEPKVQITASSFEEAVKKSAELSKPILVIFEADWCHWCTKMKNEVLVDTNVKNAMSSFILVKINTDKDNTIKKKFGITGLPSYVISNSKEEKLKIASGFMDIEKFSSWLNDKSNFEQPKKEKDDEIKPQEDPPEDKKSDHKKPRHLKIKRDKREKGSDL